MDIQELYDKVAQLVEDMKTFLDEHTDEDNTLSPEDAETYDRMERKLLNLRKNIERHEKVARVDAELRAPNLESKAKLKAILGQPDNPNTYGFCNKIGSRDRDEYKTAILSAIRKSFKQINNVLEEGVATQGGYLVPTSWDARLIDVLEEENVMRKLGTSVVTSSEHKINIAATKPAAAWISEGQALTFSNATFSQKTLEAHKLGIGIQITNELLADNVFDLESYIIDKFGSALGNAEEDSFINGTGINQPTGLLTTLSADPNYYTTTTGANISADDIINLVYLLKRPYRQKAAFLMNDSTLAQIRKFKDSTQNYLWTPSYQAGEPDRLLGYPVYTTPYMPTISSGNFVIAFGDFSQYNIADRGTRTIRELREVYAVQDISAFMMLERVDGVLLDEQAIRALKIK